MVSLLAADGSLFPLSKERICQYTAERTKQTVSSNRVVPQECTALVPVFYWGKGFFVARAAVADALRVILWFDFDKNIHDLK